MDGPGSPATARRGAGTGVTAAAAGGVTTGDAGQHPALPGVSPLAFVTCLRHSWRHRERRHQLCYSLRLGWSTSTGYDVF